MIIGDGDILCRYPQGMCDAIHLNAVDVIDTRDAVFAEADDDVLEVCQSFCYIFGDSLDAAFCWIIIFGYLE